MIRKNVYLLALVGLAGMTLAGCGGRSHSGAASTAPVVVPPLEEAFGAGFSTDFFANPNSQPAVPQAGDIIALNVTTQPMALH